MDMFGGRETTYSEEYIVRRGLTRLRSNGVGGPFLMLVAVLLIAFLGSLTVNYFQVPFWPPGQSDIAAAGGCANLDVEEATADPHSSLDEAEERVRQELIEERIATDNVDDESLPYIGELHWSKSGYIEGGPRAPQWILVFENRYDEQFFYRHLIRNPNERVTVVYLPGRSEIVNYCTGESSS